MDKYEPPEDAEHAIMQIHRALYEPQQGMVSRMDQLDSLLKLSRGGKTGFRVAIWVGGGGLALIGAYRTVVDALAKGVGQ